MQQRRFVLLCALLLVTACSLGGGDTEETSDGTTSSISSSVRSTPETANVTYTGTVRPAGISVYQEGTHRLILSDGRFVFLESDVVDLNGYVGEEAEVFGTVRPTIEQGGIIMRVERIRLVNEQSSSEQSTPASVSSAASVASSTAAVSSISRSSAISAAATSSLAASSAASTAASSVAVGLSARIELMVKEDLVAERWTQRYCSTHVAFCFPVHKNWWYKSFGTTTSDLWHVEISTEDITALGEGPIIVRLVAGSLQGTDGAVTVASGKVTGSRAWTDDRHIEVVADARLEAAVRYITGHIEAGEEETTE